MAPKTPLQDAEERPFQIIDKPIDITNLQCLRGTSIFVGGFSEQRQIVSWLHQVLECAAPGLVKEDECLIREIREDPKRQLPKNYRRLARCRETLYSQQPWVGRSCSLNVSLHFEWKSFMWSGRDLTFHERIIASARATPSRPVVVLLGGGGC